MHIHHGADRREVIQPFRIWDAEVDTAVAHGRAKIIMPVGAVQSIAFIEIHGVWDVR